MTIQISKKNKFILFLGAMGLAVLLSAFVLTLVGVIDIRYVSSIEVHPVTDFVVNILMFLLNMYFVFGVSLKIYHNKIWWVLLGYVPVYVVSLVLLCPSLITSVLIPSVYLAFVGKFAFKEKVIDIAFRYATFSIFTIIYQQISGFIKFYGFNWAYHSGNTISLFLYGIDLIGFYIFYRWVVKNYVGWKLVVFPESKRVQVSAEAGEEDITADLNRRQKLIFYFLAAGYQIFQLLVVLLIGKLNNVVIELFSMLMVFWIGRSILQNCWHSDKLWICSAFTFIGFYVLTKCTIPFSVSLFFSIVLSGGFTYLLYYLGVKSEEFGKYQQMFNQEAQLREQCKSAGLSEEMTQTAIDWKIHGMHEKDQANLYEISLETLKKRRYRINKALSAICRLSTE